MKKLASKITAVLVAAGLMFPAGTIGNIDFGLTAFAEENTAEGYTNGYQPATLTTDKYDIDGVEGFDKVYEISNAGQLYWFADKVNNDNGNYGSAKAVLTANITVNSNLLSLLRFDSETGKVTNGESFTSWTPIGNSSNQYTGTFDGQGYTISGLYFNTSTEYVGLFGLVESGGSVSNVGVVDSYFKGKNYVGGVCGLNYCGTITNCYNRGTVSGSGNFCVGGVCGMNNGGTIENCYNTGTVSGSVTVNGVGGVCGYNYAYNESNGTPTATITNCYNRGTVSGSGNYVGGVCGLNQAYNRSNGTATATIKNCYNTGNVSGSSLVGGVCGKNEVYNSSNSTATITNCYNRGTVSGSGNYVGGVCGENYAVGSSNGTATITNCYYLEGCNAEGTTFTSTEGTSKTEKQFKNGSVCYLLNGSTSTNPVWYQLLETENYPNLDSTNIANRTVYQCTQCTGVYSNEANKSAEHSYLVDTNDSTKHICENCGIASHNAVFTADDETNTISVCCDLGSVTLKAPTELTYDGTAKAATVEGELTGIDTPKILYMEKDSAEAAVETAPTNAGTYVASITYTIGENTTYSVSVEYTIGKASVTVTAKNYTVKFGNPLPESLEYETDGLMGTDTLSSIGVNVTIGYENAVTPSAIGNYIIVVSGEAATTNYNLTYVNGTLTVQKKSSGGGGGGSSSGGSSGNSSITGSSEVTTGKDSESNVTTTTSPTEVKVENGTASATVKAENVTEAIKQAEDKQSAQIVFTVSEKDTGNADNIQLTMTKSDVQQILAKTDAELVVATAAGDVILPQETLKEAVSAAGGNDITIELEKVTKPTEVQKAAAGENSYIVDVTISSKNEAITTFGGAALRIRLEVPEVLLGKDVAVIHIAADGGTEKMPGKKVKKGTKEFYEFATTHLSTFALVDGSMLEEEIVVPKKGTLLTDSATKLVYKVTKSGKTGGTVSLVRTENTKAKTVTVPAEVTFDGITYKVTSVGAYAFRKNTKIAKVVIGKNVTYIGYAAFSGATKLKTVSIGKNVTEIGAKAFFKCTGLTKLTIPAKVKKIGDYAFYGCSGIKTLALGKSVTSIGAKAFFKCTGLTSLTIPSKVSKIGKYAFYGCKGLKTITLDTTLLSADTVSERAFRGLPAEVTVSVPKKKEKAYKTLLVKLGLSKKITIKSVP